MTNPFAVIADVLPTLGVLAQRITLGLRLLEPYLMLAQRLLRHILLVDGKVTLGHQGGDCGADSVICPI